MSNFDPSSVTGLIGLWDFKSGAEKKDTGLDDGVAQDATHGDGNAINVSFSDDKLIVGGGTNSHPTVLDVKADPNSSADDDQFNLDRGTIETQFTQDAHSGTSEDVILSRGEKHIDAHDEGFFEIRVTQDGKVQTYHNTDNGDAVATLSTSTGFFEPGDHVNVKYSFDVDTGATLTVENLTTGNTETIESDETGLTFDLTDNDDEEFSFGARESDDSVYDKEFQGSIDYVALYESSNAAPDGAVDGEDFGEDMDLGYDDSNAPTDQGGDIITNDADLIFGNGGDDTINGEGGNDTIYGDDGAGGSFTGARESFNWDHVTGRQADSTVTQNTGSVNVTYTRTEDTGNHASDIDNSTPLNTSGIDTGGESIDTNSSLFSETGGQGNTGEFQWAFSEAVGNLDFNINDLDGDGFVTVTAFDADNNPIDVVLQGGSDITIDGNTADAGPYQNVNDPDATVQVSIAGPVSRVVVEHTQDGSGNSGIHITDMYFDTGFDPDQDGEGGDDVITGAEGADEIYGEGGDDTFIVSSTSDADGDTITGGNGPDDTLDNDTLDLRGTGQLTITDAADGSDDGARAGTVTFADGSVLEFSQIETILTDPQNEAPTAVDDTVPVDEDDTVTFNPTANDTDPDSDPLTVDSIGTPANGTLTDNGDGTYTYTPDENFNGTDSVSYTVSDPSGETSTATITFDVAPVNDAPDAVNDVATTDEEATVTITPLDNDTDVDGDTLRITAASVPSDQGTLTFTDTEIEFTPAEDFFGEATISYSITDDNGGTDTAEIAVTVNNINDAPEAVDDTVSTLEDQSVTFNPADNDNDPDGDPLTVTSVTVTDPTQGSAVLNGDGTVTFTPAENYNGPVELTYTVEDPDGASDTGSVLVNVGEVQDAPDAVDDVATTPEDTAITLTPLDNDTDPDGDTLTITGANVPSDQGSVTFNDTEIVFTPADNFNGDATISYTITDGNGGTDSAEIDVTVTPVNDDPVAVDDIENTDEDTPITFNPAANDTDVDGDSLVVSAVDPIDPALGEVVLNGDGTVTLTPAENYNGPVEFTYTVSDGQGGTDTGTALVNVGPVNDAPVAENDDGGSTPQGTAVTVMPLVNDSDPDGDPIRIINASVPASQGTVSYTDDEVTFTPAPAFVGEATITYTISDGNGLTDTGQISVEVTDVIGPVDGADTGEVMTPGYTDVEGDQIDGADGDDDTIFGNGGDDIIDAGEGDDTVDGGTGDDEITGANGDDSVDGGDGSDTLAGGDGTDTLNGGQGDDDIAVGGEDEASGGTGDDEFTVDGTDPAADIDATIDGGSDGTDGNPDGPENGDEGDILNLGNQTDDLTVILEDADPEDGTANGLDADDTPDITFEEIERIITGSGDDIIDAEEADGPIDVETGAGDDSVDGGDGDDMIDTGPGNDTVDAGDGSDTVDGGNGDNLIDTSSDNVLSLPDEGFPGYGPVPPVPADADPDDDRDLVTTGSGNDTITTGDDNDTINAGAGDNLIDAGIDDDEITTLFGDDTIVGGEGNDTISSGAGDDLIYGGLDPAVVPFDGTDIPDAPDGGSFGPDPDENNGRDLIEAGAGNDTVYGQDDDDTIFGGGGSDFLDGGVDDDSIVGGNGRDTILGGQGADTLEGDAGSDEFRFDEREEAFGDEIDGGTEDGDNDPTTDNENDQLYLQGMGRFEIVESDGVTPLDLTTPNDPDGNSFTGQVNFLDASGNVEGTLTFTEIEDIIPCFTPGTVIATPQGERLVEELREGDRIITRDNGLQEIRWVGRRDLSGQELVSAPHLQPVLIRAGSLGHGLPERDMMVSPQHRLLINNEKSALYFEDREVLAAAKHLTGMEGVTSVEASSVSYIHFMFDQHEVVLSNGAWTESFQPGDTVLDAMGDAQRSEIFELFPELSQAEGLKAYTAARRSLKKHEARLLVK
ncbi:Bifunctional hemolysin/adenylate cyclase precursor [Roseovarius sp. THAF9]|uniref:tandem-95 repeat protein n=1 Tax=Roseovarius sp. THAF9 TaxID=2587847 RepID=UPI0012A90D3E|nr:tandem-95 repeat protein [Roseovarius sp. THAF9]QFT92824.1 Bifunctional hemolysin/adenylate cyclase precursor [Roseovarius sp. THAF9]